MSRATALKTKLIAPIVVAVIALGGLGSWAYIANSPSHKVETTRNSQQQTTYIKYQGQAGVNALALLKKHASVITKHYSFGDQVTAINGSTGNGPKYWTFYVNGKEASVGAGAYVTKTSDSISWKLQ